MVVKVGKDALLAIEDILRRGNDAIVYRRGGQIVVAEEKRTIKYNAVPKGDSKGQSEPVH